MQHRRKKLRKPASLRTCVLVALVFGSESVPYTFAQDGQIEPFVSDPLSSGPVTTGPRSPGLAAPGLLTSRPFSSDSLIVEPAIQATAPDHLQFFDSPGSANVVPDEFYPHEVIPHPLDQSKLVSIDDHNIKDLEPELIAPTTLNLYDLSVARYTSYRYEEDAVSYMPGDGEQFGWLSFESPNYLQRKDKSGFSTNINLHLLSGPQSVHLPPRLYDFELGYQARHTLSDQFSYEWSTMVGIYSDFEDSARDGVRFPAHAVGMFHPGPRADWVFGIDFLDRDDIQLLPVFGMVWHNPDRPELRYELVFPRPRIDWTVSEQSRVYWSGTLGGGSWDIEFPDDSNDVMTYRDYKLAFGIERANEDGGLSSWELGWNFSRKLEFRDHPTEVGFGDAVVIRYVTRK